MDEKENQVEQIKVPEGVDKNLYIMVLTALKENPKTLNLSEEQKCQIAELAIIQGKFNDELWLHDKIKMAEDDSPHIPGSKILKIPVNGPASIESQNDLDEVLKGHQAWMDSVLHPSKPNAGGRANLSSCNLSGMNLEGVDLRGANLMGANLSEVKATGANLTTCNLEGANLKGAQLDAAKLRRCKLEGADLSGSRLTKADLRRVTFNNDTQWTEESLREDILADHDLMKRLEKIKVLAEKELLVEEAGSEQDTDSQPAPEQEFIEEPHRDQEPEVQGATSEQDTEADEASEDAETDVPPDITDIDGIELEL